ncbi:hypothetical protein U5922_003485 [Aquicoccus sp. G2-2]|uniref:hypothetical protein n=1 Tax=Aquicoccus sp. G2-2 TaxID=3092120 RepID=UPI002ADF7C38|nr:hypothetical protein [Aquicoccus sp. G2-2]MEA1112576.1 hypothetical protein [Aquicoccus sp. G2-2]
MGHPNTLAYLVLAAWPLVSLLIFRKFDLGRAIIWSLVLAYLFLPPPPAVFDYPLLPPLSKKTLPPVVAFVIVFFMRGREMKLLPHSWVARVLMITFVFSPLATVLNNGAPVFFGQVELPALRLVEAVALMVNKAMLLMPFVLAYNFLRREDDQRDFLVALLGAGLVYSLLMLVEIRLSPQINIWLYGYFQHNFDQMMRFGGFRPIVFLYHGLWVAFFALMVTAAAAALARGAKGPLKTFALGAAGYMWVVLVLCKSVASIGYSLVLVPMVFFAGQRWQFRVAAVLAFMALAYPALRGLDMVPTQRLVSEAADIDQNRANSLKFRFDNEQVLMERARLKPIFGWGSWGRNQILDPGSGEILTVTDGRWIITIGEWGWVGFIAEFGMLGWPLLLLAWRSVGMKEDEAPSRWLGPVALLLGFNIFDLLPNATITTLTFLMAGMILGYIETRRSGGHGETQRMTPPRDKDKTLRSVM